MIRVLTFTTLYPNAARPNHGVFVENRLRHLLASQEVDATVLAPVPFFPSTSPLFGDWARHAAAPAEEYRHGIRILHPRYLAIPRFGMSVAPLLLVRAALRGVRRLLAEGLRFDLIDSHYVYPDGVAAVRLGRQLGLPVVITARGSDITQLPQYALPRRMIRDAVARADALVGVSSALAEGLVALGAPAAKVRVLRNGVDTVLFHPPADRAAARTALGFGAGADGPVLLSVGHLIPRKGHHLAIAALERLPGARLLIVGEGPERAALERQAAVLNGVAASPRVRFLGARPHAELPALYGAADALVLASAREGWANVLLEAMACGTPVVASNIPGNPEVVRAPEAGVIVAENTPAGFAGAAAALLAAPPARAATRAYAERFGWDETSAGQAALFRAVLAGA